MVKFLPLEENVPWNQKTRDFREIFTTSCRDAFVIGTSYATKPSMPYYGHVRVINIFTFLYVKILLCE